MAKVSGTVPNLINGISQQAANLRLPSQLESCENIYPTIVDGAVPRPATAHLAMLGISVPAGSFTHWILRDNTEKYILVITPAGAVRVWDLNGVEKTVTNSGASYLAGLTDLPNQLRALTVADYTFIVNKTKVVAAGTAKSPARPFEALVGVLAGNYGKTYKIFTDGLLRAEYTPPNGGDATHAPFVDTVYIADQLWQDLDANGFNVSPWTIGRYHSTIYIRNTTTDFAISTEDGFTGRAMKEVKGTITKFADLPQYGPNGVVIKVAGDAQTGADDYYVRFDKTNVNNGFGVWKETLKPDCVLGLDAATMPHTLRRNEDGTFTFGPATWGDRTVGDTESCPDPSFVGQTIEDVFFHRNRLGVLTKESYVFSAAGDFFRFYRTTMTALLDDDPIDGAASHIKVSLLRHAVPFSETLLLFTDQTQFRLEGNELLTPKTVNAKPISELGAHTVIRPVPSGNSVYFVTEGGSWTSLYEYFIDKQVQNADAENVSGHVPSYVPANVTRCIASPELDLVIVHSADAPSSLYLYKYHWAGQEKLQSAWVRWTFPGATKIIDVTFDKKDILLLIQRPEGTAIERIYGEPGRVDPNSTYRIGLDRAVTVTGSGTYDEDTDTTTFNFPLTFLPANLKAVTTTTSPSFPDGVELEITTTPPALDGEGTQITVRGDARNAHLRCGIEFTASFKFSTLFYRGQEGKIAQTAGRLGLLHMTLNHGPSAYFEVSVTNEGRDPEVYPFTGTLIGSAEAVIGSLVLRDGKVSIPVFSRNDRTVIEVRNPTWRPCSFTSASWAGNWNPHSREL